MRPSLPTFARNLTLAAGLWFLLPATCGTAAAQQAAADRELQRAIESAGNDRVALARNLEDYLRRFPDSPRRTQVFRALIEVCLKLDDRLRAIEFAERFIALEPEDSAMMLLAAELLEEQGDTRSLTRAVGYLTRILDRVEKEQPDAAEAGPEWTAGREQLLTAVYLTRARVEIALRQYAEAAGDLNAATAIRPTAEAVLRSGELAELQGDYVKALDQYIAAYFMPDSVGSGVNRASILRRVENMWRMRAGSDAGLDERLFIEFNRVVGRTASAERPAFNAGVSDPFAFRLRRPGGGEIAMTDHRGKLLVLHFWATWCLPCREVEPLFDQVAAHFAERTDVVFLAVSLDGDEKTVADYLRTHRMRVPVAHADGLERVLQIPVVPTVVIVGSNGRVVHRRPGFVRERFTEDLVSNVQRYLGRQ